jgi:hypothetical protein
VLSFFPSPEGCTYSGKSWSWAFGPLRIMSGMNDEWRISWVKNREADLRSRSCNQKKKALMTSPTRECNLYHPIVTKSSCKTGLHGRCHLPAW